MYNGQKLLDMGNELMEKGFLKEETTDVLSLSEIMDELDNFLTRQSKTKYPGMITSNADHYLPNELIGQVLIAKEGSYLLPDSTGIIYPHEEKHVVHGSKIHKFSSVDLSLTPDIQLLIQNKELNPHSRPAIANLDMQEVKEINELLFLGSFRQVLCKDKCELERFKNAQKQRVRL